MTGRFFSRHSYLLMFLLFSLAASCEKAAELFQPVPPQLTPRESYNAALDSTGIGQSQLARSWRQAAKRALTDSVVIESPFRETGYFRAEKPAALGYRIDLKVGELLKINLLPSPDSTLIFADLFFEETIDSVTSLRPVFHAEAYHTDSLRYEAEYNGIYLLRVQPELLANCRYLLEVIVQPSYSFFPVSGKSNRDVWSFFGDPRDAGRRVHKGIDIFARRGTPVVAAVDGRVRRVRDEGLGGKQVWLLDTLRQQSLYYAHLDSQYVAEGIWVKAGDTLGTVGNTGNARTTSPHLHFSIYKRGFGAIDPHPFVARRSDQAPEYLGDTTWPGQLMRVRESNANLRVSPRGRSAIFRKLERNLPVEVLAATKGWYRIATPDGKQGYLFGNSLEDINRPLERLRTKEQSPLWHAPDSSSVVISSVEAQEELEVIGKTGEYHLIRRKGQEDGWMKARK